MAGERVLPGLGLTGYWDVGSDGWNVGMDSNLRILSAVAGRSVKSRTTSLPGTPASGDIYIVPSGDANGNAVAIWDGVSGSEAWVYLSPDEGWRFWVADENVDYVFDGAAWISTDAAAGGAGDLVVRDQAASYTMTAADFADGNLVIRMTSASANTVTIPAGLTAVNPAHVIMAGDGQTSFAPSGTTLLASGNHFKIAARESLVSIIPILTLTDTYQLVGPRIA